MNTFIDLEYNLSLQERVNQILCVKKKLSSKREVFGYYGVSPYSANITSNIIPNKLILIKLRIIKIPNFVE